MDFRGAVALVTGAGSGIGRALAVALASRGCRTVATDADLPGAQETAVLVEAAGGEALAVALDVTSREQWDHAVAQVEGCWGPVDLLCSNAGSSGCRQPLVDLNTDYLRWLFEVNVFGAVHAVQSIVPGMLARARGAVLFTGSMGGLASEPTVADYCASKHALLAIAESLRQETRAHGITVSYLCPSGVPTQLAASTRNLLDPTIAATLSAVRHANDEVAARAIAASGGLVPAELVAEIALKGLQEGLFFIPTHPKSGAKAQARHREFENALAQLAHFTAAGAHR
jgi:NAD(P)-dependent dehydrogenase (short-subunit alcohol dehydrogenase family)